MNRFLRIILFACMESDLIIGRTSAHVPVSGDRKSGIPAEVLTPDDDS
jgi:hypothetical protein